MILRNLCGSTTVSSEASSRGSHVANLSAYATPRTRRSRPREAVKTILITVSLRVRRRKSSRKTNIGLKRCTRPKTVDTAATDVHPVHSGGFNSLDIDHRSKSSLTVMSSSFCLIVSLAVRFPDLANCFSRLSRCLTSRSSENGGGRLLNMARLPLS